MKTPLNDEQGAILVIELSVLAVVLAAISLAFYDYTKGKSNHNSARAPVPHVNQEASASPAATHDGSELHTLLAEDQRLKLATVAKETYHTQQPQGTGAGSLYPDARYGASISSCYVMPEDGSVAIDTLNDLFATSGWSANFPEGYNLGTIKSRLAQGLMLYGYSLDYSKVTPIGLAYAEVDFPEQAEPDYWSYCLSAGKSYTNGFRIALQLEYLQ